jgi:AcrR family transcriptional regulator
VPVDEARPARRPYAARLPAPERREQLLAAAQEIALRRGFHAVSIDGVARACGVTRPVVYGAFTDRTALLTAMLDRAEQRVLTQLAQVFPPVPGPQDEVDPDVLLVDGITAYLTAITQDPDTWRVILVPPEGAPPELAERVTAQRRVQLRALRGLLEWGLARRGGPDVDADLFARSVFTLAEGAGRLLLEHPGRWSVEELAAFARTVLAALRPGA